MSSSWREVVAQRTSHGSLDNLRARVTQAEANLRAAGHEAIEDATNALAEQSQRRLRAWSADRQGLTPESAADLDRQRSGEMWANRYGIPVEGSPIGTAGAESQQAYSDAIREKFGYDVDLRSMPKPGTPEFMERYCQKPERIERIIPRRDGKEGFEIIKCKVDGTPDLRYKKVIPLETPGPGPARGTPEYSAFDHTPKAT